MRYGRRNRCCAPVQNKERLPAQMKVVINALQYKRNSSGIGVMIRDLFGAYCRMTRRPCQIVLPQDSPTFPAGGATFIRPALDHGQGLRRMAFQAFRMGRLYCKDAVLLTTDSKTPFFLPRSCRLTPVVTDLALYRLPEAYQRSRVLLWKIQYRYVRRRASLFLAISAFTKKEIVELFGVPEEKVRVVPCACSDSFRPVDDPAALAAVRDKYALPERYVLFVGNANPRKNLERMVRAFARMKRQTDLPHTLVIAGGQGWKVDRDRVLAGAESGEDVRFIGFVPDEDMPALYSGAALFVFPTLYEGFGIPVLEAQRCGVPVVTSNCSSLPEVAGDGAVFVDPLDERSICEGMTRVLSDPALSEALVEKGRENAKRYSWAESAALLDEIMEREVLS